MSIEAITPTQAKRILEEGGVLADIREADEFARERIPGAVHAPLSGLESADFTGCETIIFHCRSGSRTLSNAARLAAAAPECRVYIVAGGLEAWRKDGLPTVSDKRQPIELMRQVQIAAGAVAALGALGALALSPWFALAPLVVGSGLVFAGATGRCGLAAALRLAPWNRRAARALVA